MSRACGPTAGPIRRLANRDLFAVHTYDPKCLFHHLSDRSVETA